MTVSAVGVAAALVLAGCSDSGKASDEPSTSATPTVSSSSETPAGVELTEPGSQLAFGDTATVDYEVKGKGKRSLLEITVASAVQGQLKDFVGFDMSDPLQKNGSYYYVRVAVTNKGDKRFGGVEVPLWGISGTNTLLPPVRFTSAFKKCPTDALPATFAPGATFRTCLVFLSPNKGSLEGVSYRPLASFDPIEWHGEVKKPATPKPKPKPKAKKKPGGNG